MTQDNQFHQLGYEHYLKAPKRPPAHPPRGESVTPDLSTRILERMQTPVVATISLLVAGALFAGVIIATYPSSDDQQQAVPIVKADLRPIREIPQERGGMSIPHRESTVLAQVGQPPLTMATDQVENLLAPRSTEELMSKEQALDHAMATQNPMIPLDELDAQSLAQLGVPTSLRDGEEMAQGATSQEAALVEALALNTADVSAEEVKQSFEKPLGLKEPDADNILQKISSSENPVSDVTEMDAQVAKVALMAKPNAPAHMVTAAQSSPDTMNFVREVLGEKKAVEMNNVQPAVGAATTTAPAVSGGSYFVQLASITDPARADREWAKMQIDYPALANAKYRVQEASLATGKFYRIQAGPMGKANANSICDSLKASGKPGGCLVVK